MSNKLLNYFTKPTRPKQKQYEAVRAFIVDKQNAQDIATRFGYTANTVYTPIKNAKNDKLILFPETHRERGGRRTPAAVKAKIIKYRNKKISTPDIYKQLTMEKINTSVSTISRILQDEGFRKLKRRTYKELGISRKGKEIPESSENMDFSSLEPFTIDCPVAGIFQFLPYIIESGVLDIVQKCQLPQSSVIGSLQANLSILALKLIGNKRLSHVDAYDHEPGLGVFAGLNVLPKPSYMGSYSCLTSEEMLLNFQEKIIAQFIKKYPNFYKGEFINLDFKSIAHYGDKSQMEKVWCGSKGKTLKGANTVIVQDSQSNAILYTRADILRKEESGEIKRFVSYWRKIKTDITETLVFDCNFTKYGILDELADDGVRFITLRKRNEKLLKETYNIPEGKWEKINLSIPKRKYKKISVYEDKVCLPGCKNILRQIIIKNHGRENPTFIVTNNCQLSLAAIVEVYAKRWHVEQKIGELVAFFNFRPRENSLKPNINTVQ